LLQRLTTLLGAALQGSVNVIGNVSYQHVGHAYIMLSTLGGCNMAPVFPAQVIPVSYFARATTTTRPGLGLGRPGQGPAHGGRETAPGAAARAGLGGGRLLGGRLLRGRPRAAVRPGLRVRGSAQRLLRAAGQSCRSSGSAPGPATGWT
jgi:hypothetical protein